MQRIKRTYGELGEPYLSVPSVDRKKTDLSNQHHLSDLLIASSIQFV
jgi:hypothetical protein